DPGRIRQIMLNLLSNAIKFTEKGYILITVDLENKEKTNSRIRISIEDTGIGIAEDKQTIIFNKFDQADGSTTRKYGGTGLGLSISQQLSQMMGGDINVSSQPGMGTTFSFTMDLMPSENKGLTQNPEDYILLHGLKALVVDNMQIACDILIEQIQELKLEIHTSDSSEDALEKLITAADNNKPYAIIFLNSKLPEMDGEKLVDNILLDHRINGALLVFITSTPYRGQGKILSEKGVDAYLTKPIYPKELNKILSVIWSAKQNNIKIPLTTRHSIREVTVLSRNKSVFVNTHILVAEDNPVNQMVASELLEGYGCIVTPAGNGIEAVAMFNEQDFDLILMDCQMPEMDGFEATGRIRQKEAKNPIRRVPIVAFTANAMQGDREKCIKSGMDDYISKPVNCKDLEHILIKWIPGKLKEISLSDDLSNNPLIEDEDIAISTSAAVSQDLEENSTSNLSDIIDLTIFNNLKFLFKDKFPSAIAQHKQTLIVNVEKAQNAIDNGDTKALSAVMHSIKSSSRQFGALQLGDLSERIEQLALDNRLSDAKINFDELIKMHKMVIQAMANELIK
ncbi:MAG: response regulator, partial [Gammaproteobacteria bacterium]|nr:response regulator [Gammaproteobacteria bacterium]